jgi:hypothetical protein
MHSAVTFVRFLVFHTASLSFFFCLCSVVLSWIDDALALKVSAATWICPFRTAVGGFDKKMPDLYISFLDFSDRVKCFSYHLSALDALEQQDKLAISNYP